MSLFLNPSLNLSAHFLKAVFIVLVISFSQGCGKKNQEAAHSGNPDSPSDKEQKNLAPIGHEKSDPNLTESEIARAIEKSSAWGTRKAAAVRIRRQALEALDRVTTGRDRRAEASRYASSFEFQNATAEEWNLKPLQDALYADAVVELGRDWVRYIDKNTPDPTLNASQRALIESWSDDGIRGSLLSVLFFAYESSNQVDYPRLAKAAFIRERFWTKLLPMVQKFLLERVWAEMNPRYVVRGRYRHKIYIYEKDLRTIETSTLQDWTSRLSAVIQSHDWLLKRYPGYAAVDSKLLSPWHRLDFVDGSFSSPGTTPEAKLRALTLQLFHDQIDVIAQSESTH